jgi:poly(A) polymerase
MYYDPASEIVVDYHNGIKDSKKLTLRMIGDPVTRYREDPVRIIRAIRFSAKLAALGFKLEPKTAAPQSNRAGSGRRPQSRLFDGIPGRCRPAAVARGVRKLARPASTRCSTSWWARGHPFVHAACRTPTAGSARGRGAEFPAGLRAVGRRPRRLGTTQEGRHGQRPQALFRRCRMRSTMSSTPVSAAVRAVASWPPTCADLDDAAALRAQRLYPTAWSSRRASRRLRFQAPGAMSAKSASDRQWWQEFGTADDLRRGTSWTR